MTHTSYRTPPAEIAAIHEATCRDRRQGLACSTCDALNRRAAAASALVEAA